MELVDKLRQAQKQISDPKTRLVEILDREVRDILDDLESTQEKLVPVSTIPIYEIARWKQFLLLYKQASLKGKIYKVGFYGILFFVVNGVIRMIGHLRILVDEPQFSSETFQINLLGIVVFGGIGLAYRAAAVREYRRFMKKAEAAANSG